MSGALMASGYYPVSAMRFLQWHAWTGVLGWFSLMIVALGTRLVPMFMLSHVSDGWARVSGFILVIAPVILFGEAVLEERGFALAVLLLVLASYAGFCLYLIQCIRKRMRRKLESPMLLFFSSFLFPLLSLALIWGSLLPVGLLESSMESYSLAFAAMILILLGFVGSATLGMGFKILPFMSWMALQSGGGRTGGVPLPQDIGLRWIPGIIFFVYPGSVLALASGVLFPTIRLVGAVGLIVSIALYSFYFIHLLLFLLRRRVP
ncbi:MAG TPA: hypothetical protein DEA96_08120 [Leptospiraceae bacterium]|nr:hypothetical protein [Leptospiraceae bacterium]